MNGLSRRRNPSKSRLVIRRKIWFMVFLFLTLINIVGALIAFNIARHDGGWAWVSMFQFLLLAVISGGIANELEEMIWGLKRNV